MISAENKDHGRGWYTNLLAGAYVLGLWRDILKDYPEVQRWVYFRMGRGDQVLFWLDVLCGLMPFSQAFLDLFSLALMKDGLVMDHIVRKNGRILWDLHFR